MDKSRLPSRTVGVVVLIVGVLVALGSGFAETLGVGGGTYATLLQLGLSYRPNDGSLHRRVTEPQRFGGAGARGRCIRRQVG